MSENRNSDSSDMEFLSDLLNCDTNQLRAIDDDAVRNEAARLASSVTEHKQAYKCHKCQAGFTLAKNLIRHLKNDTCTKKRYICENCGKTYEKKAFLNRHNKLGKCVRPRQNENSLESTNSIKCKRCGARFSKQSNLTRHLKNKSCSSLKQERVFECGRCSKTFSSAGTLKLHAKTHEGNSKCKTIERIFECRHCSKTFSSPATLKSHAESHGVLDNSNANMYFEDGGSNDEGASSGDDTNADDDNDNEDGQQSRRTLFQGTLVRYTLKAQRAEQQDLMYFFTMRRKQLRKNLLREFNRFRQLKWYVVLKVDMVRYNSEGELVDQGTPAFRSFTRQVLDSNVIDAQIDEAFFKMLNSLDTFRADGSGWMIRKVLHMEQTIAKYSPLGGSCFNYDIPESLLRKRCLLNVTGPPELDGHCFRYAVLAGLYTDEHVTGKLPWSDLHQHREVLKFDGVASSGRYMPISSISEFEKNNELSINVYGYENDEVFPVYVTKLFRRQRHVNLLLLCPQTDEDDTDDNVENFQTIADNRRAHYCVIKNISGLVASQVSQTHARVFVCMRCLTIKHSAESLSEHEKLCFQEDEEPVRCFMPGQEDKWLKFRNLGKRMKVSFVIVACFACYTVPLLSDDEPTEGYEVRERRLDPCAYSYMRISVDNSHPKEPVYYRGTSPADTMDHFLSAMASEEEEVSSILSRTAPIVWCDEGLANMETSNDLCFVCQDPFLPGDKICVDHSHVSGEYSFIH
ncbi:MAG: C2H2-type zinc finger protein [Candidatus Thiodiazotropha sp.]